MLRIGAMMVGIAMPVLLGSVPAWCAVERSLLATDVPPQMRAGRTFVPLRAVATGLSATTAWQQATQTAVLTRGNRTIRLRVGSRRAEVDGQVRLLEAAPFVTQSRVMVPLRFVGEAFTVPVAYDSRTASALLGQGPGGTLWVVPLESLSPGIVIHTPQRSGTVTSPLRVHGQANVFEGLVEIEVQDSTGKVLGRGFGTGAMGAWHPFTATITYTSPQPNRNNGRLFVYSPSVGEEQQAPLHSVAVPLTLQ